MAKALDQPPNVRQKHTATNRLAGESSAYLRQHMRNPVAWYPWGPEALERARREDKPLLISIGYSACHWCHVMERESFEDPATAELMNQYFVNIKVDREERPDLDQIYMDAALCFTGHGGWPLTLFCTPDGRPFSGGTYFPPQPRNGLPSFRQMLEAVAQAYKTQRKAVQEISERVLQALRRSDAGSTADIPGVDTLRNAAYKLLQAADSEHGGFGRAPKFPTPPNLEVLLLAGACLPETKAREARSHVVKTCREMTRRGLFDQLGGGFHRYSVDQHWGVPHFEKMLYDQAQLLRVYSEAWRRTGARDEDLLWPVRETAAYLLREMCGEEGGFYASQDADSEGEEGRFYVWTPEEIEAALGAECGRAFCTAYGVHDGGNFEAGRSVLWDVARRPRHEFATERQQLLAARGRRVPPATDRKRIAAWNGLAISGLALAGSLLPDNEILSAAVRAAEFVCAHLLRDDGQLFRIWDGEQAKTPAFLDDYAALLAAFLDLERAGAGTAYGRTALLLGQQIQTRFFDPERRDLFLTPSDAEALVHRPRSDHDGATPHAAGLAVLGLLRLAERSGQSELHTCAKAVLQSHAIVLERQPSALPTLARAAYFSECGLATAVIIGPRAAAETKALAAAARRALAPEAAVFIAEPGDFPQDIDPTWFAKRGLIDGRPALYLCRGATCAPPITQPDELARIIHE